MSYILDALKRADAERGRGTVPGLHARQIPVPTPANAQTVSLHRGLLVAGALAVAGLTTAWWVWQTQVPPVQMAEPTEANPSAMSTPEMPQAALQTPPAPAALAQPAAPALALTLTPKLASAPTKPARPTTSTALAPGKPAALPKPAPAAKTIAPLQSMQGVVENLPLLSQLPESIRNQIPPLKITGAVYSGDPAQRILLVNNQVLSQGSQVTPDVKLEEIRPSGSVLSFQGTRFRVAH